MIHDITYSVIHYLQHRYNIGNHNIHHNQEDVYPLYTFAAGPIDCLIVQFSAELPFFIALLPIGWDISLDTWRVAIAWLVFCGVSAHTRQIWLSSHWKHHKRPSEGRYSFTGIGEAIFELVSRTFFENSSENPVKDKLSDVEGSDDSDNSDDTMDSNRAVNPEELENDRM